MPEAYERLLLDILHGANIVYAPDEVEAEWKLVQPILDRLAELKPYPYSQVRGAFGGGSSFSWMGRIMAESLDDDRMDVCRIDIH